MKLGICTRYNAHEAAFAAIRLATAAEELGLDVEILTMTEEPARLCPRWDKRVMRARFVPFSAWAMKLDHIIWTTVPHFPQIDWVRKMKKRTSVFLLWNEIDRSHNRSLMAADQLICPSNACFKMMVRAGFQRAKMIPWDCGHPLHRKPDGYQVAEPKVLLPFWDGNARRIEMSIINLVDECLWKNPDTSFTLVCNSSTINPRAVRGFNELAKRYKRVTIVRNVQPHARFKLFQDHDMTLCPFHYDNLGMTALQSIELGTPVVGFAVSPCDEFMHTGNSLSVNCSTEFNDMQVPRIVPDYLTLERTLVKLLADKARLRMLHESTLLNADARRAAFAKCIRAILL